jgi:hypothetical protein
VRDPDEDDARPRIPGGSDTDAQQPDVTQAVKLFHQLGDHHKADEITARSWELGAEYLRNTAGGEFDLTDQESRWEAFLALERAQGTDIVLADRKSGIRYVRAVWFTRYLRENSNPGEPAAIVAELRRLGWTQPGEEGRIKATQPQFGCTLQWAFYTVPKGWEDQ